MQTTQNAREIGSPGHRSWGAGSMPPVAAAAGFVCSDQPPAAMGHLVGSRLPHEDDEFPRAGCMGWMNEGLVP